MRMVKRNPFLAGVAAILGGVLLVGTASAAEIGSDKAAAIVVFPKLVANAGAGIDTAIQVSNTSPHQIAARCFLVNANSHCANAGATDGAGFTAPLVCTSDDDCNGGGVTGGKCVPGWMERDFSFRLTARQPIWWLLSTGLPKLPLDGLLKVGPVDNDPSLPDELRGQPATNAGRIPPAPEDPFIGELKCIQVNVGPVLDPTSEEPTQGTDPDNNYGGDLKGEATIIEVGGGGGLDARAYNAIGIQSWQDVNNGDDILVLGSDPAAGAEYAGCPSILILDHFFDDAADPVTAAPIRTTLTMVPCSEDFYTQSGGYVSTVAQMLIYNEFEQRFSTSRSVRCFDTIGLSDIASAPGPADDARSIFNVAVQGTLTGQTRIRAVDGNNPNRGDGLLALAEETHNGVRSAAVNVHFSGTRSRNDVMVLAPIEPDNP
ncbi:MAG: hypothetical protein HY699_15550 [Deltaproteobacteria bacterium]|nr:hypothetical protein [Deltaproteobacteria bacterium]